MTMKIDLHIHSNCSDGRRDLEDIFQTALKRNIEYISITDHDSIDCQETAAVLAGQLGMHYLFGLELNVSFSHPDYRDGKPISLDFLGYQYDIHNKALSQKLIDLRDYRRKRAEKILKNINEELTKAGLKAFTHDDMKEVQDSVEGTLGRPHLADYLVKRGIVRDKQEAFDRYLVKCNVPKMPLSLPEASDLVKGAGGKLILAHPNHPRGTSLVTLTPSLREQQEIIEETMLSYVDGIECWHSSHDEKTTASYLAFSKRLSLMVTGGSDCHQNPVLMGTPDVPGYVVDQFDFSDAISR
jgi:predicted metal-dependent phosphoesterase TrpH